MTGNDILDAIWEAGDEHVVRTVEDIYGFRYECWKCGEVAADHATFMIAARVKEILESMEGK